MRTYLHTWSRVRRFPGFKWRCKGCRKLYKVRSYRATCHWPVMVQPQLVWAQPSRRRKARSA